ncbi:hypothetical protein [Mycoplasma sp. HU2014]|uniref:hypothetical protein n=1 Tax=Mycoplasma sp. HU2014 TaxID=1664275 RepID=UPI0006A410E9|nr:hypothetical protein [Mycoplasma sp. HU2014]KNG79777.1 hypothetical protein AB668_02195 [Mycoplasma sp. HU2014]MBY7704665.1 hypothetical protein [Vibrio harveyi]
MKYIKDKDLQFLVKFENNLTPEQMYKAIRYQANDFVLSKYEKQLLNEYKST